MANVYFGWPDALRDRESGLSDGERAHIRDDFLAAATSKRDAILERALELPGARVAAVASRFPGDESDTRRVEVDGGPPGSSGPAEVAAVGAGFFELLEVGPEQGRDSTAAERAGAQAVAVVDEPFVRRGLGGGNAVGRRLRLGADGTDATEPGPWLEIVGVVPDLGLAVGDPSQGGTVYTPVEPTTILWLGVRGDGDPARWTPALLEAVREVDPEVRVRGAQTLERLMMLPVTLHRSLGLGFLALGAVALLLSAASLHAVTACAVTSRTRELGIRRALGARTGSLVAATVRRAAVQLGAGGLFGAVLAAALLRLAAIFPWRLGAASPVALGVVPAVLGLAVLAALLGPLARALRIPPADALRHE